MSENKEQGLGRTVADVLRHAQAGAFIDVLKLNLVHQGTDQFESPSSPFFPGIGRIVIVVIRACV